MLKATTKLSDHEASVPSLMTGSSCTPLAPSDGETSSVVPDSLVFQGKEEFSTQEENLEKVVRLMQQALQEAKAKLQESQNEIVSLQAEIVQQRQVAKELRSWLNWRKPKY